jgi:anti-sigma-K factor RskA
MSSSHHSLVYLFWGMLLIVVAIVWSIVIVLNIDVSNTPFLYPLVVALIGMVAIATAFVWHRLTKG